MSPLDEEPQSQDAARPLRTGSERQWAEARQAFQAFRALAPEQRPRHTGLLLQHLSAWLLEGIRQFARRYYLLVPTAAALARLFAHSTQLERFPASAEDFLLWTESHLLCHLDDLVREQMQAPDRPSEPPGAFLQSFNRLPFQERALLYLFLVEGESVQALAQRLQMSPLAATAAIARLWSKTAASVPHLELPARWQRPDAPAQPSS